MARGYNERHGHCGHQRPNERSGDNLNSRSLFGRAGLALSTFCLMSLIAAPLYFGRANAQDAEPSEAAKPATATADSEAIGRSSDTAQPSVAASGAPESPESKSPETAASVKPSGGSEESRAIAEEPTKPEPSSDTAPATEAAAPEKPAKPRIVVRSWAGAYGEAQNKAIIAPLARDLDMEIERLTHGSGAARIDAADAAELDQSSLISACAAGQLVKMRTLLTPEERDGSLSTGSGGDFLGDSVTDCGVPTFAWSSILVVNDAAMKKLAKRRYREAGRLADLLNVKRYPGRRALIRSPKRLLEMMLMGVGVDRDAVYDRLATRQGQDDAFEALDQLSKHVLWVDGPREAMLALDQGDVTIAMTYSGRAFRRLIASRLRPIWDGHVIDFASWAVPSNSQNRDEAKRFILAATSARSLAAQARLWPYGPMRRSALPLARRHDLLDAELEAFLPTSDLRFGQGLLLNAAFWAKHGAALQRRFDDWQAGVPLGIRVPLPAKAPPPPVPPLPGVLKQAAEATTQ